MGAEDIKKYNLASIRNSSLRKQHKPSAGGKDRGAARRLRAGERKYIFKKQVHAGTEGAAPHLPRRETLRKGEAVFKTETSKM